MSTPFADAFFDQPQLLAVRRGGPAQLNAVRRFAATRGPDTARASPALTNYTPIIGIGIVVLAGAMLLRGCNATTPASRAPAISATLERDHHSTPWTQHLTSLTDDLMPSDLRFEPWYARSLPDLPSEMLRRGVTTDDWLKPRQDQDDQRAFRHAQLLAQSLSSNRVLNSCALVLDLPGPQSVAAAAGLAEVAVPVFACDSLPHVQGIVPAGDTLGAMLYWRPALKASQQNRSSGAPPLFVLDGNRLTPYANEVDRFDNRSRANLPDAAQLTALGVTRVIYIREHAAACVERDDLNAAFLALNAAGIQVQILALPEVEPSAERASNLAQSYGWGSSTTSTTSFANYRAIARTIEHGWPTTSPARTDSMFSALAASTMQRRNESLSSSNRSSSSGGSWSRSWGSSSG